MAVTPHMDFIDVLEALLKSSRPYGVRLVCVSPRGEDGLQGLANNLVEQGVLQEVDKDRFVRTVATLTVDCSKEPLTQFAREVASTTTMVRDPMS